LSGAVASAGIALWLSRAIVLALAFTTLLPIADRLRNPYALFDFGVAIPKEIDRERIQSQLNRTPGEHLVIVHYQQRDVPSVEWVYNRDDIDHAKVVWARDMGAEANQELVRYFASRRIWYVDRNAGALLVPYTYTARTSSGETVSCHPANGLPRISSLSRCSSTWRQCGGAVKRMRCSDS